MKKRIHVLENRVGKLEERLEHRSNQLLKRVRQLECPHCNLRFEEDLNTPIYTSWKECTDCGKLLCYFSSRRKFLEAQLEYEKRFYEEERLCNETKVREIENQIKFIKEEEQ